jgi:trk system potassium uptake protein TrkA
MGNGNVNLVCIEVPRLLVGHTVNDLMVLGEIHIVAICRKNNTFIPNFGTIFEERDMVYISVIASAIDKLKSMLDLA